MVELDHVEITNAPVVCEKSVEIMGQYLEEVRWVLGSILPYFAAGFYSFSSQDVMLELQDWNTLGNVESLR